jgi:hypothetical protein
MRHDARTLPAEFLTFEHLDCREVEWLFLETIR